MTISTAGWVLPASQLDWDRNDWLDAFAETAGDTFPRSVIWASDNRCQLAMGDLQHLLKLHGFTVADLDADLVEGQQQGAAVLPLTHAAQALVWLGY